MILNKVLNVLLAASIAMSFGCATKINSVQAGYSRIGANLSNAKKEQTYSLQAGNNKRLSSCQADGNGGLLFQIQPENDIFSYDYLYLTDGKDVIKFKNDHWKFRNPVWDKTVELYKPILSMRSNLSKSESELASKSKSLDESLSWLD